MPANAPGSRAVTLPTGVSLSLGASSSSPWNSGSSRSANKNQLLAPGNGGAAQLFAYKGHEFSI
jgi:hypothetical protein